MSAVQHVRLLTWAAVVAVAEMDIASLGRLRLLALRQSLLATMPSRVTSPAILTTSAHGLTAPMLAGKVTL